MTESIRVLSGSTEGEPIAGTEASGAVTIHVVPAGQVDEIDFNVLIDGGGPAEVTLTIGSRSFIITNLNQNDEFREQITLAGGSGGKTITVEITTGTAAFEAFGTVRRAKAGSAG